MIVSPLLHWIFFFQKYLNVLANIKWVLMETCVSVVFSVFHRHGVFEAYCFAMMNKRRHVMVVHACDSAHLPCVCVDTVCLLA